MEYLDIKLENKEGKEVSLRNYLGEKTILYFYPKDNTPGCTMEAKDFTNLKGDFEDLGYKIIGVSADSVNSHVRFIGRQDLKITLLSDHDKKLIHALNVEGEKKNYGKVYIGLIRSTFLIDEEGTITKEYRNVRAKGHAERVLRELKESM